MRKITNQFILILCFALSSQLASAMELGKLTIYSALGEPLNVEIELLAATPEDLAGLTASLASEEQYKAQGINKTAFQQNIKADVIQKPSGVAVVQLTSIDLVQDAFLDMLVQVVGTTGQLSREYTLLLDPSVNTETNLKTPVVDSVNTMKTQSSEGNEQSIKTVAGDSLSSIAKRLENQEVSLDQLMLGLYKANPSAFIDGNMNRLKVGEIVRVPSQQSLQAIPKSDAKAEIRAQVKSWKVYTAKLADAVSYSSPSDNDAKNQNAGKIVTDTKDNALTNESADVIKIEKADAGKPSGAEQVANLEDDLAAKKNVIKETDAKSALLEKQISDMKQLLVIKSKPLSTAQDRAKQNNALVPYNSNIIILSVIFTLSLLLVFFLRRRKDKKLRMTQRFMGDLPKVKEVDVLADKVKTRPADPIQKPENKIDAPEFLPSESAQELVAKPLEMDLTGIDLSFESVPQFGDAHVDVKPIPDAFNGDFSNLLKVDIKSQKSTSAEKPSAPKKATQKTTHHKNKMSEVESSDVATKLELAIAYIDMADKEGALELLAEALKEGGPQQRERAQTLIDSLA